MRIRKLTVLLLAALCVAGVHFENRVKAFSAPQTSSLNEICLATPGGASGDFGCEYDGHVQLTTFGNVRSPGGEALPEVNFGGDGRFQGMWKDAGTGLYYVRARYYDPKTGRFLSRDPAEGQLEQPESFMPYVFANSNPYLFDDPTGRTSLVEAQSSVPVAANISQGSAAAAQGFLRGLQAARLAHAARTLTIAAVIACAANYGASMALGQGGGVCQTDEDNLHIVRIQVQGSRVLSQVGKHTLSRAWRASSPATVAWGVASLEALGGLIGRRLRRDARPAFTAATNYISNGPRRGGLVAPGRSFYIRGIPGSELRVDVEIKNGVNFTR
jgi:RHS repeat-associated protein